MPHTNRHFIPGFIRQIANRCRNRAFLRRIGCFHRLLESGKAKRRHDLLKGMEWPNRSLLAAAWNLFAGLKVGLPFEKVGLPFEKVGLPFGKVGLPFEKVGLRLENVGLL